MKSKGIWRNMAMAIGASLGLLGARKPQTHNYPDPQIRDPYVRLRSGRWPGRKSTVRLKNPPFKPGTIVYHDWLVRELGYDRRLADGYQYAFINKYKIKMPMPGDLVAVNR